MMNWMKFDEWTVREKNRERNEFFNQEIEFSF